MMDSRECSTPLPLVQVMITEYRSLIEGLIFIYYNSWKIELES